MLFKQKISALLLFTAIPLLKAGERDNITLMHYQDIMYLGNMQYQSNNPVSILYQPIDAFGNIAVDYNYANGDFRRIDKAPKETEWGIDISGLKKFGKLAFQGNIAYTNGFEHDRKWNSTLYIAPNNPYILADSVKSRFSVEKFVLNGGFAYDLSKAIKLGLKANYQVGSSANQTDPRPETRGMRFQITPGADFHMGDNFTLGISAKARWMREETAYTCIKTTVNHQFFIFSGMGTRQPKSGISYNRKYKGSAYGGDIQLAWNNHNRLANFLEGGIELAKEDATDGGTSYKFKGGKYKETSFNILDRFRIKGEKLIHNLTLCASINSVDGTWYNQKEKPTSTGESEWIVLDSSIGHKEDRINGSLTYRMDVLKEDIPHLTWSVTGGYEQSETKHFPDEYIQKYSRAYGKADISKYFDIKHSQIGITLGGAYYKGMTSDLNAPKLELKDIYTSPLLDFLSADFFAVNAGVSTKIPLNFKKLNSCLGIYAKGEYQAYQGNCASLDGTHRYQIKGGVNFTF